jgi:hypothetical protein
MNYCDLTEACGAPVYAKCTECHREVCRRHADFYDVPEHSEREQEAYFNATKRSRAVLCSDCRHKAGLAAIRALSPLPQLSGDALTRLSQMMRNPRNYTQAQMEAGVNEVGGLFAAAPRLVRTVCSGNYPTVAADHPLETFRVHQGVTVQRSVNPDSSSDRPAPDPAPWSIVLANDGYLWRIDRVLKPHLLRMIYVVTNTQQLEPARFDHFIWAMLNKLPVYVWQRFA